MVSLNRSMYVSLAVGCVMMLDACSTIPTSGPSRSQVGSAAAGDNPAGIQIVDLTDDVARKLYSERKLGDFADVLGDDSKFSQRLGIGDTVSVAIWEAPPATLFASGEPDAKSGAASGSRMTSLPAQTIDGGNIRIPFVGAVKACGGSGFSRHRFGVKHIIQTGV